jgi:hypothetical protein
VRERLLQEASSCIFSREAMKPLREKTLYVINRRDAAVKIPCFAQDED